MKVGFDLDGTLDVPALRDLANALYAAGHEVFVVTGGLADTGAWTQVERERRLAALGVNYTEIVRCITPRAEDIGRLKAQACTERDIPLLIDDDGSYINGARAESAGLCLLHVR